LSSRIFTHAAKEFKIELERSKKKFRLRIYKLISDDELTTRGVLDALKFLDVDFEKEFGGKKK
jgi:hypothetical protein